MPKKVSESDRSRENTAQHTGDPLSLSDRKSETPAPADAVATEKVSPQKETAPKTTVPVKTQEETTLVPAAHMKPQEKNVDEITAPAESVRKPQETGEAVTQKVQPQEGAASQMVVLPPEVVEALKKVNTLDEKFNSLPQLMKRLFPLSGGPCVQ